MSEMVSHDGNSLIAVDCSKTIEDSRADGIVEAREVAPAEGPIEKVSPCGTKKLLCFGNCCKIVKASNPKMPGYRSNLEAMRLWCPPEEQSRREEGDAAPQTVIDVEDLVGKRAVSPRRSDTAADSLGLKRTRSESDITDGAQTSTAGAVGCGQLGCGASQTSPGSTLQQIFARSGMNQDGTCTADFVDECFPELGKADYKKFSDHVPLVLVGPSCMPKTMCPVVEQAWLEFRERNVGDGSSSSGKPYIDFRARATTDKNISKMETGTSVFGQAPSVMIVDSSRDAVYVLPITNWKSVLIKRCTRYREARVAETVEFFLKSRDGTWPRAPRGVKRPFRDQHPQYGMLKSAVQSSWESLVNSTCVGYAPDTYDSTLMKEAVQQREKNQSGDTGLTNDDPAVVRPKDVLVVFTKNDCAACTKFLPSLNTLIHDLHATAMSNVPCLGDSIERAKAWSPLSVVVVNMEENELPTEVIEGISYVPAIRLYPADCSLVANLSEASSEIASDVESTPKASEKTKDMAAYHHEHRNRDGTVTSCSLLAHPPLDFEGNRSHGNILQFLKEHSRNKEVSSLIDIYFATKQEQ